MDRYKPENPGAQLAISRNGQTIFSRAWGMADLEHNVPLTNESVIEAGSVSKQFTAAAILLLEQQGNYPLTMMCGNMFLKYRTTEPPSLYVT
ncbi:MAG: serine hydrolase domain-containing protein [Bacteroidota bacterium]